MGDIPSYRVGENEKSLAALFFWLEIAGVLRQEGGSAREGEMELEISR